MTAFQTHFAAQSDRYAQRGSSSNSLPISCGQIIWDFFLNESVHSASFKRKNDAHTPTKLLKGRALLSFYCQTSTCFQGRSTTSTAPCQYVWIEAHLFVLYFLTFKLALPSWKPHWSCWPIDLSWHREFTLPVFFLGNVFVKNEDINMLCKLSAEPTDVTFCEDPTFSTVLFFLKTTVFGSYSPLHLVSTSTAVYLQGDREETRSYSWSVV